MQTQPTQSLKISFKLSEQGRSTNVYLSHLVDSDLLENGETMNTVCMTENHTMDKVRVWNSEKY